jgi:glycosyltransferase involved in cell wall biosynthesis
MPSNLSVLIPAHNERDTIEASVRAVQGLGIDAEIIVIDDGSDDGTGDIARRIPGVQVIRHPNRRGKGRAIRTALPQVTGDVVVIHDADLEYDARDLPAMLRVIDSGDAEVVYGSRFRGQIRGMRLPNLVINKILMWLANLLFGARITDEATCYKMFRTDLLRSLPLRCEGFEFCPEVTAKCAKRGRRIAEVPIRYRARSRDSGKKIRWTDGVVAIWTLLRERFTP